MPSVQAQPYPTCEAVMNRSRSFINDMLRTTGGQILTDNANFTLDYLNSAIEEVELTLSNNGLGFNIVDNVILSPLTPVSGPDPNTQVYVGPNGYFNGSVMAASPALPPNLAVPLRVFQRETGSNQGFVEVPEAKDGIYSWNQGPWFGCWEWRGDLLWLNGCNQNIDLRIRYEGIPPIVNNSANFAETIIMVKGGTNALAYALCKRYAEARGPGSPAAASVGQNLQYHLDLLVNQNVRAQQRNPTRSRGFRDGSNHVDGSMWGSTR